MEIRDYSRVGDAVLVPNLVEIQTRSYHRFLQRDVPPRERENVGLEAILRETFPIPRLNHQSRTIAHQKLTDIAIRTAKNRLPTTKIVK